MKRIGDCLAVLAVLLAALLCANPRTPWLRDGFIYVSPSGCDWHLGDKPERAVRTIQCAADRATPGEAVVILPGTYRERLFMRRGGKEGRPVTFRASEPGTVLITGAAPPATVARLNWKDEGGGVFSCAAPWPIYHVTYDGSALFRCGRPRGLRRMLARDKAWPSFAWRAGRLYVGLPDGRSPESARLALNGTVPPPREWGIWKATNAWIEADHLRFEGLRFSFGVGSGLHLWQAEDVTVTGCAFTGVDIAVHGGGGRRATKGLRVERCLFHNYPQGRWLGGWAGWAEVYARHARSTLVSSGAGGRSSGTT